MIPENRVSHDAATTPVGEGTVCAQCGVMLDTMTTTCGACGAVVSGDSGDGERSERVRAKLQEAIGDAFTLGDVLGRGGMGIVFRAREKALDRDVALKVLAFDPILNPVAYTRFEREAKLAARLDHPGIVPIFAVGQRNGVAYYTMRLVKAGNLEQRIVPGRGIAFDEAMAVLRDVAGALDYAHASGVVHRDIKPANVLLGESGHALVADFGIARAFGADSGAMTVTHTGVIGSPAYMSPEQWRGEKVDGRADQYALGVLAFELFTGRRPFQNASMQELLRMHLSEDPPALNTVRDDLPARLSDAILRAMSKEPADRFATCNELVQALAGGMRGASAGVLAAASRVTSSSRVGDEATTRPTQQPASTARGSVSARTPLPATTPNVSSRSTWLIAGLLVVVGALGGIVWIGRDRSPSGQDGPAVRAPAPRSISAESVAALERAQDAENSRLQREVADARRIALNAEHQMELLLAKQRAVAAPRPSAPAVRHAHLFVMAHGGAPAVLVDGKEMAASSPAVIEVTPGHHVVTVQGGGTEYQPAEYSVDLAFSDTMNVTFISRQIAQRQQRRPPAIRAIP